MSTASLLELTIDTLLEEVKNYQGYRSDITNEAEAIESLNGSRPYTYMIRKGQEELSFYVTYMTQELQVISEKFIIDPDKLQYQYWNAGSGCQTACTDPYYLKYFSNLDDIVYLAAMKCNSLQAQALN